MQRYLTKITAKENTKWKLSKQMAKSKVRKHQKEWNIPDQVQVFPYVENVGLGGVLALAKPLTGLTVAKLQYHDNNV